jgi:hypothetical protein
MGPVSFSGKMLWSGNLGRGLGFQYCEKLDTPQRTIRRA